MKTSAEFSLVGLIETYRVADLLECNYSWDSEDPGEDMQTILNENKYEDWTVTTVDGVTFMVSRPGRIYESFLITCDTPCDNDLRTTVTALEGRLLKMQAMLQKVV